MIDKEIKEAFEDSDVGKHEFYYILLEYLKDKSEFLCASGCAEKRNSIEEVIKTLEISYAQSR